MPGYAGQGQASLLRANQQVFLFRTETSVVGAASIACQLERVHWSYFYPWGMSYQAYFTDASGAPADPGAFEIDLQSSDIDEDGQYCLGGTLANAALNGNFAGRIDLPTYAKYIRAVVKTLTNPVYLTLLATFSGGVPTGADGSGGGGSGGPFLPLTGGTLSGALTVNGAGMYQPALNVSNGQTTLDSQVIFMNRQAVFNGSQAEFYAPVNLLQGATLTLYADPTTALQAATKQYVDNTVPQVIQVADEATALSESAANPNNIYFWV